MWSTVGICFTVQFLSLKFTSVHGTWIDMLSSSWFAGCFVSKVYLVSMPGETPRRRMKKFQSLRLGREMYYVNTAEVFQTAHQWHKFWSLLLHTAPSCSVLP